MPHLLADCSGRQCFLSPCLHDSAYQYFSTADIRRRAGLHGYRAEKFFLGRGGGKAYRIVGILQSRGIEGLIIMPQSS